MRSSQLRRRMLKYVAPIPGADGYNWLYYETASANQTITLFYFTSNIDGQMIVDGVSYDVPRNGNFTFSELGVHLVKYKELNGGQERRFSGCAALVEAYMLGGISGGSTFYSGYFNSCINLKKAVFLNPTTIGNTIFDGCSSLTDISLDNVTDVVGMGRFGNYNVFQRVSFPDLVSYGQNVPIGTGAFESSSSIQTVDFGPNIEDITGSLLYGSSCKTLIVRATTVPSGQFVYGWNQTDGKIYVPYSADHSILNAYKAASNFSAKASIIYELNPDGTIPT